MSSEAPLKSKPSHCKTFALKEALKELSKFYYTIHDRGEVIEEDGDYETAIEMRTEPIAPSNFGYRLLQKQGWIPGKSLGKQGIVDPIGISGVYGRRGFGARNSKIRTGHSIKGYQGKVTRFAKSKSFYDLVFDEELSTKDRKLIHEYARTFGLCSKSINTVDEEKVKQRRLILSRKIDYFKLATALLSGDLPPDHVFLRKYKITSPITTEDL